MPNLSIQVFKNPSDHLKWHKQIEYASLRPDISEERRHDWIDALDFLRKELGKGFLKSCGHGHPIKGKVFNKAPWQVEDLINFSNMLRDLRDANCNFKKLVEKLLPVDTCRKEGIPFTEIAHSFRKAGFDVSFPDENEVDKCPDIEIVNPSSKEKVFIEVSYLQERDERKRIKENYDRIVQELMHTPPNFQISGRQLEYVTEDEMPELLNKIKEVKQEVDRLKSFQVLKDNKIEVAIAYPGRELELHEWCEKNGKRDSTFVGLPIEFNETNRLLKNRKIEHEADQLPKERPGLIYIPVNPWHLMITDLDEAAALLGNKMSNYPNLIGIMLYSKIGYEVNEDNFYNNESYLRGQKRLNELTCRDLFFVFNDNFSLDLSVETMKMTCNSFFEF